MPVRSVVDVGCGRGAWLSVFRERGVRRATGIDGDYVERDRLLFPREDFVAHDLSAPFVGDERYDLVVSLEVGEHLPERSARPFVRTLASLGSVVLFSAAIPGQGGLHHVNEQWPDYWAALFAEVGFAPIDCIRPRVWDDPSVEVWYAQNTLLFATDEAIRATPALEALAAEPSRPLAVVHPRLFASPRPVSPIELARIVKASFLGPAKRSVLSAARRLGVRVDGRRGGT
jgi:SAM-dependent methyltransferase